MIKSKKYDVTIVGAGPAGCTVAKNLSDKYKVLLLDRLNFPREKACGGLLIEESQDFLKEMKMPNNIFSFPKYLGVKYVDWDNNLQIRQKRNIGNISRKKFDYWLFKLCREKVDFLYETYFLKYQKRKGGLKVFAKKNSKEVVINTKYLVFATGSFLPIRKIFTSKKINYYIVIQWWLKTDKRINDFVLVYDNKITDSYSYLIPKNDYLILGVGLIPGDTEEKMRYFVKKLEEKMKISGELVKKEIDVVLHPRKLEDIFLGKGNVIFVGEAAGFVSSNASEGISFALRSGYNCAKALNNNFKNALREYKILCEPLVKEIEEKIQKFNVLSDPIERKKLFLKMK